MCVDGIGPEILEKVDKILSDWMRFVMIIRGGHIPETICKTWTVLNLNLQENVK